MMLALAPLVLAAAFAVPAPEAAPPSAAPIVDDLRYVPLSALVHAASEMDLNLRMDELGLVGSAGLFGAKGQVEKTPATQDCDPR